MRKASGSEIRVKCGCGETVGEEAGIFDNAKWHLS